LTVERAIALAGGFGTGVAQQDRGGSSQ